MLKKLILAALAGLIIPVVAASQVTHETASGKPTYISGPVSEEIKQKCSCSIMWNCNDAVWLKEEFAPSPSYSLIQGCNREAVKQIKDIFDSGVSAHLICTFLDSEKSFYVSVAFKNAINSKEEPPIVVVYGTSKEEPEELMVFLEVIVTKKTGSSWLSKAVKGAGLLVGAFAVKVVVVDPLVSQRRTDTEKAKTQREVAEKTRRQEEAVLLAQYEKLNDDVEWAKRQFASGTAFASAQKAVTEFEQKHPAIVVEHGRRVDVRRREAQLKTQQEAAKAEKTRKEAEDFWRTVDLKKIREVLAKVSSSAQTVVRTKAFVEEIITGTVPKYYGESGLRLARQLTLRAFLYDQEYYQTYSEPRGFLQPTDKVNALEAYCMRDYFIFIKFNKVRNNPSARYGVELTANFKVFNQDLEEEGFFENLPCVLDIKPQGITLDYDDRFIGDFEVQTSGYRFF